MTIQKRKLLTQRSPLMNTRKDKTCHYCNKKGHIQPDCRKKKADQGSGKGKCKPKGKDNASNSKGKYNTNSNSSNKGKGKDKSKGYGRGNSWNYNSPPWDQPDNYNTPPWNNNDSSSWNNNNTNSKGFKRNKGQSKGSNRGQNWSDNFPSDYNGSYANFTDDNSSVHSTLQESDLGCSVFHTENVSPSPFSMLNDTPTVPINNAFADIAVHVQHLARQMDRHRLQVFHPTLAMSHEIATNSTSTAAAYFSLSRYGC
jgi:hypothetical protein